jgi:hypothetical protein
MKENNNDKKIVAVNSDNNNDDIEPTLMKKGKRTGAMTSTEPTTKRMKTSCGDEPKIRPTLRGLTVGAVAVGNSEERHDVCVWGEAFPSWLLCLDSLGFKAQ